MKSLNLLFADFLNDCYHTWRWRRGKCDCLPAIVVWWRKPGVLAALGQALEDALCPPHDGQSEDRR